MSTGDLAGIAGLGAFHGLNPAMGWLFAVALALQEGSRRVLWGSFGPIAAGHAAAIALAVVVVEGMSSAVSPGAMRVAGAAALVAFALWKLIRRRHLRWVGFRLRKAELALWSFLMASAHGAGLMLLPFLVGASVGGAADLFTPGGVETTVAVTAVHTAAMVAVAALVAVLVFEVVGVGILRSSWIDVDRLWAGALLVGAAATLFG
ncbi:MAG TPA: hypothetical protein VFQ71_11205 [Gaiellales bacterium]|nr:hypothetical protein [Gaiellales bacterium]